MIQAEATEEMTDVSPWAKETIARMGKVPPQFASKKQAIEAFTQELNAIAAARSMTVEELMLVAPASVENHEDFDRAIRLTSLIYAFKNS